MTDPNYVDPAEFAQWEADSRAASDRERQHYERDRILQTGPLILDVWSREELATRLRIAIRSNAELSAALDVVTGERDALRLIVLEYEPDALRYVS